MHLVGYQVIYQTEHNYYVMFNGVASDSRQIMYGVPQGSILGPLLFLIYINDFANICSSMQAILYADDTNVFISGRNIDEMIDKMNCELKNVTRWLNTNKLSLNVCKTHYVIFAPGRKCASPTAQVIIDNCIVSREYSTMFLGVKIDSKLTWWDHVQYIKKKIAKNVGVLSRAKHLLKRSTMLSLYYSFIYPYLTYCLEIWGMAATTCTDSLLKLQKRFCRMITSSENMAPSEPLFKALKILPIQKLYDYSVLVFIFKFYHGYLPNSLRKLFAKKTVLQNNVTRNEHFLVVPKCKTSLAKNYITFQGPSLWNLHCSVVNYRCSIQSFKYNLRSRFFE